MDDLAGPTALEGAPQRTPPSVLPQGATATDPGNVAPAAGSATALPRDADAAAAQAGGQLQKIAPPGEGARVIVTTTPATRVALSDPSFDPAVASYLVAGDDLIITLDNGGTLVLESFFSGANPPPMVSILEGPELGPQALLEALVAAAVQAVEPAADQEAAVSIEAPRHGGGASFASYEPGAVGESIPETSTTNSAMRGGETEVGGLRGQGSSLSEIVGGGVELAVFDAAVPMPVVLAPPQLSTTAKIEISFTDAQILTGYQPPPTTLPPSDGTPGDPFGLPRQMTTLDETREVRLIFQGEATTQKNAVGAFTLNADGTIGTVRIVFGNASTADSERAGEPGATAPGTVVSLGVLEKGTAFGLFLLQDGFTLNDGFMLDGRNLLAEVEDGRARFEIRSSLSGEPVNLSSYAYDPADPPVLTFVSGDGTTVGLEGALIFAWDPSESSPAENPLNPSGLGHVTHDYDGVSHRIEVGFDDGTNNPDGERRFTNVEIGIEYGNRLEPALVLPIGHLLQADIADADSAQLSGALIRLDPATTKEGDLLIFNGAIGDGYYEFAGTNITVQLVGTEIRLQGLDSMEAYKTALGLVQFGNFSGESVSGLRMLETQVIDDDGLWSTISKTSLSVSDNRVHLRDLDGYSGTYDVVSGTGEAVIGTAGKDVIQGGDGDDILIGNSGDDLIVGGKGDDVLIAGAGRDRLIGGEGADTFLFPTLGTGRNVIVDFDPQEGDRLNLEELLTNRAFDPTAEDASNWLRFELVTPGDGLTQVAVILDLDGLGKAYNAVSIAQLEGHSSLEGLDIRSATTFDRFFPPAEEDKTPTEQPAAEPSSATSRPPTSGERADLSQVAPLTDIAATSPIDPHSQGSDGATI
jgi:RTX calcium-binding nonapeptide repeat (4 copies)